MEDKKTEPFYRVPKAIMDRDDLPIQARWLWVVLRDMQGDNGHAWPGYRFLCKRVGISSATLRTYIDLLVTKKLLKVARSETGGTNKYTTMDPKPMKRKRRKPTKTPLLDACENGGALHSESASKEKRSATQLKRGATHLKHNENPITRPNNENTPKPPLQRTATPPERPILKETDSIFERFKFAEFDRSDIVLTPEQEAALYEPDPGASNGVPLRTRAIAIQVFDKEKWQMLTLNTRRRIAEKLEQHGEDAMNVEGLAMCKMPRDKRNLTAWFKNAGVRASNAAKLKFVKTRETTEEDDGKVTL